MCKGTDFPGLLRPMDNTYSASDTGTVTSSTSEPPSDTVTGTGTDTGTASKCDQKGDGGVNLEVSDEDDDGNKKEIEKDVTMNDRQEEEAVGEREQKEEVKQLVKEGMESLLPVLGEEVTEKVNNHNHINPMSLLILRCIGQHSIFLNRPAVSS